MRAVIALLTFGGFVARPGAGQVPADRGAVRAAVLDYVEVFYSEAASLRSAVSRLSSRRRSAEVRCRSTAEG